MQITFTLSPSYTGATYVAGPFNISGTTSDGTTTELASNVTKAQLTTGYSVNNIAENMTGGTIQSIGTCSTSQAWLVGGGGNGNLAGNCWTLTYFNSNPPTNVSVRYRDINGDVQTTLITNLESMDNGDGSYTAAICVNKAGAYNTPVCVSGGVEVTCDPWIWGMGGECSTSSTCFLN